MTLRPVHIILILLLVISSSFLSSQIINPRYNFKHLNVQNGLAQNIVYYFCQDSRGYIWISSWNGLSRFDGIQSRNYQHNDSNKNSISGNFITRMIEDDSSRLWIGSNAGLNMYNRQLNNFTSFDLIDEKGIPDKAFCLPLGFGAKDEMWLIDGKSKSIKVFNTRSKISTFIITVDATDASCQYDSTNNTIHIWTYLTIGTTHFIIKNNKIISQQTYFTGKETHGSATPLKILHVLPKNDSTIWLSTDEGLIKLNPLNNNYRIFDKWNNKQPVKGLRCTAYAPDGLLWVSTGPTGIFTFDTGKGQFIDNFRNSELDPYSICSDNIVSLYFDRIGNIWCGSYGQGISYTNTENNFFSKHLSKNEMSAWKGSNNILWMGHDNNNIAWCIMTNDNSLWRLDEKYQISRRIIPLTEAGTPFKGSIYKLVFDENNEAWCATIAGLFIYNPISNRMRELHFPLLSEGLYGSKWMNDIIRLKDGSYVFSTFWGLYLVIRKNKSYDIRPLVALANAENKAFRLLFRDKEEKLYVRDFEKLLHVLTPVKDSFVIEKSIPFLHEIHQYAEDTIRNILWIATNNGLFQLNKKELTIEKPGINSQLPFSNISGLWLKENKLCVFGEKGMKYFDLQTKKKIHFSTENGLQSNQFNQGTVTQFSNGDILAGTTNGAVSFHPDLLNNDKIYPPQVQITGIHVNDSSSNFVTNPQEQTHLTLSHNQNTFSVYFAPIAYQHIDEFSYQYRLQGYDDDWIQGGTANYTRYSKIPPGKYIFNLRIIDRNGEISTFIKTLEIEITKAFWQTNFFIASLAVLFLFIVWLLIRSFLQKKISKQKREFEKHQAIEKERTRIATDMHDDLGAGLSRIKFLSQSISHKKMEDESIKTELEKITSYSNEMTEKMGEIVWALNEKNDTLADLVAYTRSYAVEYLANHDIACEADTPLHLPGTFITGEIRRNIFLSVKECLHNIVKHSGATHVKFSIQLNKEIQIVIHDNGKGIDWEHQRAYSNGINNIRQRMKEIKGQAAFSNEAGTKVVFTIPLLL